MIKLEDLLVEAGFFKKLANKMGLGGGDPVKSSDLKQNEVYRIWHDQSDNKGTGRNARNMKKFKSAWTGEAVYVGSKGGYHQFELSYVQDKEPMTGNAPKKGDTVEFADNEVEKVVVTSKDAEETQ